jgi:peptide chain release factor 1
MTYFIPLFGRSYKRTMQLVSLTSARCNPHTLKLQQSRHFLSPAITKRLDLMVSRHNEILKEIEESPDEAYIHGKELASLSRLVSLHGKKAALEEDEDSMHSLILESEGDEDMALECQTEIERIKSLKTKLDTQIRNAILPKDEDDYQSNAIVEIRAGTGGDEATLFASELREAYEKTAKVMRWECEVMYESRTELGGIKETGLSISGRGGGDMFSIPDEEEDSNEESMLSVIGPYGLFKYESGVHRVQRVPVNDTRIHTSACSVAVLPLLEDDKNSGELLPMTELKIETMRSSGAGGQHVNTTESAVRITHIPTGITASIQDERSQHKNKDKALKLIAARVRDLRREEEERKLGEARNSLLGGGDRSERIRTYNYPQDRVTDHRCKHTTHGISKLLEGSSDDGLVVTFYPILQNMAREEQIALLEKGD